MIGNNRITRPDPGSKSTSPIPRGRLDGRIAVFLLVSLVVGCQTVPRPSPASEGPACAWQVCLVMYSGPAGLAFDVVNREPVPATIALTFRELRNLEPDRPLPVELVVPPNDTAHVVRLRSVRPGGRVDARPSISIDLGSSDTDPDLDYPYAVPFGGAEARELIQGFDGPDTHREAMRYALDFAMPIGTPILAARGGTVLYVQDGFTRGARDPDLLERANVVVVAHSDGSMASYGHLAPGIPVNRGDVVRKGDLLGRSGATGFLGEPHLHFHVGVRLVGEPGHTIPVKLHDGNGEPLDLEVGDRVAPARPTAAGER